MIYKTESSIEIVKKVTYVYLGMRRLDTCPARKAICEKQGNFLEAFIAAK